MYMNNPNHDEKPAGFGIRNIIRIVFIIAFSLFFMWCVYKEIKCCLFYLFICELLGVLIYIFATGFVFFLLISSIIKGAPGILGLLILAIICVIYTILSIITAVLLYKVWTGAVIRTEEVGMRQVPK
ncbi:hypothetical protein WR25_04809 [Diploscapter pachys]|uniref:Uncharacterized protein n=1 Tax=Diploscapter pachys TaxID=2018661 RepID=A0A2A2LN98_9BILA|nr:hypothetical protein WR25_04809 [Diploscapter pachys]